MDAVFRYSIFVFFGIAVAIVIAVLVFIEPGPRKGYGPMTDGERAAKLALEGKRLQIVTLVDGLIPLPPPATAADPEPDAHQFAIVAGQITLDRPEPIGVSYSDGGMRGFKQLRRGHSSRSVDATGIVSGTFNNVLIYDKVSGVSKKVFDSRITITKFKLFNDAAKRVVVFVGTSDDTNRDGRLDDSDLQRLFVYAMDDGQLRPVAGLRASPTDLIELRGVDYFVVEGAVDADKDGEVGDGGSYEGKVPEPRLLYRVDLQSLAVKPLIDSALINDVQATLDGVKPVAVLD